MTILEHIKQLSANLLPQDKQALTDYLMREEEAQTRQPKPQSLRGIWQGAFPDDLDLDASLTEIRSEWEKEWSKGVFSG
ncbi:MAG: hypothetical protein ABI977_36570 [Acidobacteriota bacterium]